MIDTDKIVAAILSAANTASHGVKDASDYVDAYEAMLALLRQREADKTPPQPSAATFFEAPENRMQQFMRESKRPSSKE